MGDTGDELLAGLIHLAELRDREGNRVGDLTGLPVCTRTDVGVKRAFRHMV